jgi:hypothetical protein
MKTFMRQSLVTVVDALRKEIRWIAANVVCMLAPIIFECWLESPRSEWDALNGIDVWCTWMIWILPFLALIFIANIIWLVQVLKLTAGLRVGELSGLGYLFVASGCPFLRQSSQPLLFTNCNRYDRRPSFPSLI